MMPPKLTRFRPITSGPRRPRRQEVPLRQPRWLPLQPQADAKHVPDGCAALFSGTVEPHKKRAASMLESQLITKRRSHKVGPLTTGVAPGWRGGLREGVNLLWLLHDSA